MFREIEAVAEELPTRAVIDVAGLDESGTYRMFGWALGAHGVVAIEVYAGAERLGTATYGLPRPDVSAEYPRYPRAAHSGFTFSFTGPAASSQLFELELLEANGRSTRVELSTTHAQTPRPWVPAPAPAPVPVAAPRPEHVLLNIDQARCDPAGRLQVVGWAFAPEGIERIEVVGPAGHVLATAECNLARPDVRAAHRKTVDKDDTGFACSAVLPSAPAAPFALAVRATTYGGEKAEALATAEIVAELLAAPEPKTPSQPQNESFRLFVDSPASANGVARQVIRDRFSVLGWALARAGVERVEVLVDGNLAGTAYYGTGRPDIEQAFPDWSNAARSGFAYTVPTQALSAGQHVLRVRVVDKDGSTRHEDIKFEVDLSEAFERRWSLRTRVPYAETSFLRSKLAQSGPAPSFVLVVPVRRGNWRDGLVATLRSLHLQTTDDWQAILAHSLGDADLVRLRNVIALQPPEVRERIVVREAAKLSWHSLRGNGAGPVMAGVLAPGGTLAADALMQFAVARAETGNPEFMYCDERRWSEQERRQLPFFKPAWSPETLLAFNYIGNAWLADVRLLKRAFADPAQLAFAGPHERVLRLTESARGIERVSRLLIATGQQRGAARESEIALKAALRRRGEEARVVPGAVLGTARVRRALSRTGKVSIIIPTIAAGGMIEPCIESIRKKSTYRNFEIILLDNIRKPDAKWKKWFQRHADKVVRIDEAFNWSRFNNIGRQQATGDYLLFLNDDIEVIEPGWLEALLEHAQRDDVGVVGPQLLYADGKVQHAGMFLANAGVARHAFRFADKDEPGYFGLARTQRNVIAVTGACMLMRAETFDRLGGFDERHQVVNNDVDLCLRAHTAGLQVIYTPYARLYHHEQVSRAGMKDTYDTSSFAAAWGTAFLKGDPYFSPNLSVESDSYALEHEPVREVFAGHPVADARSIRRILVVKLDHIGDFITALPAIRRLRKTFPRARLSALVGPAVAPLAREQSLFEHIYVFSFFHARSEMGRTEVSDEDLRALRNELEPFGFDLAVDLRKHVDTRPVLQHTGARLLAGFDKDCEFDWLDIAIPWEGDPLYQQKRNHASTDLLNLVGAIENATCTDRNLLQPARGRHTLRKSITILAPAILGKPFVCVHPAAGNGLKQWPPAHFATLIDLLVSEHKMGVVLIGAPGEAELAEGILGAVNAKDAVCSLAGKVELSELPELIGAASLFVGNDSGPKHVAAGLGVPTVALHSDAVSAEEWGPVGPRAIALRRDMECGPCYFAQPNQCHRAVACLTGIGPWQAYSACTRVLAPGK